VLAEKRALKHAWLCKPCELVLKGQWWQAGVFELEWHWSPQQIAGWLKRRCLARKAMHGAHETIYRSLYM